MIEPRVEVVFKRSKKGKNITPYAVKVGSMVIPVLSCDLNWRSGSIGELTLTVSMNIVDLEIIKETEGMVETTKFVEVK